MNALGWLILGSIAHATAFAVIASVVYLAVRRSSPAAGALAATASLLIMALVSMIVVVPLPRWWTITIGRVGHTAAASRPMPAVDHAKRLGGDAGLASAPGKPGDRMLAAPPPQDEMTATSAWISRFLIALRQPVVEHDRPHWGWPEWVALGFFASFGLGVARLALGVWSIQRLRAGSLPVEGPDLRDLVDILRAELSCSTAVEVRETAELTTPATIGWRRPLLLLPGDWRYWNETERRAVLAHELAHVCRGDFLTGLAAQFSLTLHFYNPLAHWLAARLRLEQELAADAWGACLAGGNQSYLATLAQMALRRDSRALTWPARAFLPSRGTFVRRIEMLRNTSRIRHAPLPTMARLLTIGVLSVLGLVVAVLRGPAGVSTAQAQQPAPDSAKAPTNVPSYNLAFLPADAKMVVAVRPQALFGRRDVRTLLESIKRSPAYKGTLAVPPEEVEQLLVFWEGVAPAEPGRAPMASFPSGGVLRTSKPQDWKSLLTNARLGSMREVRHDGQTYLSFVGRSNGAGWGAFAPDDRTLVFAREDLLRELIEDRKAPAHPWDEAWNKAIKGQVMVAFETRWLRRHLAQGRRGGPSVPGQALGAALTLETISPLLDKAQSYALGIDASQGLTVDVVALASTEDNAKPVASTLQALLTLGRNAVEGMRQDARGQNARGEAWDGIVEVADALLNKARLETSGRTVHLQAKSAVDLAAEFKLLAPAVAAANSSSRRMLSANKLQQVALAFHNHLAANNCFPAPVLYGGASGKVPYSWRVAILPYLEQSELYKRYNFDEPWDGPNNRKLVNEMPTVYSYPALDGSPESGSHTAYFVFTGKGTALSASTGAEAAAGIAGVSDGPARKPPTTPRPVTRPPGPTLGDITDGSSNTILAVEAKRDIPWTKPEDIPFDPDGALPALGGFSPNGFNAAFADGAARFLSNAVKPTVLKALITRAGGEVVLFDDRSQPTLPAATTSPKR